MRNKLKLKPVGWALLVGLLAIGCGEDEPAKEPTPPVISDVKILDNGDTFVTLEFKISNPDGAVLQEVGVTHGLKGQSLDKTEISFTNISDTDKTVNTKVTLDDDTEFDVKPYVKYGEKVVEATIISGFTFSSKWNILKEFPGVGRIGPISFAIGNIIYIGLGANNVDPFATEYYKDFWMYDTSSDQWTKLTDFPGGERSNAFGFVLNGKGYVGAGRAKNDPANALHGKLDFWEFNSSDDSWIRKNDLPLVAANNQASFLFPVGVASNGIGYYGTGRYSGPEIEIMYKYDALSDSWDQIANYPVSAYGLASFIIGNRLFVGEGAKRSSPGFMDKFFRYDFPNGPWIEVASSPIEGRRTSDDFFLPYGSKGFSIGDFGYLVESSKVFQYDPLANSWSKIVNFADLVRGREEHFSQGFTGAVANGKAYYGLGFYRIGSSGVMLSKQWCVFDPSL